MQKPALDVTQASVTPLYSSLGVHSLNIAMSQTLFAGLRYFVREYSQTKRKLHRQKGVGAAGYAACRDTWWLRSRRIRTLVRRSTIGARQKKRPCSRRGATVARQRTHSPPSVFLYLYSVLLLSSSWRSLTTQKLGKSWILRVLCVLKVLWRQSCLLVVSPRQTYR